MKLWARNGESFMKWIKSLKTKPAVLKIRWLVGVSAILPVTFLLQACGSVVASPQPNVTLTAMSQSIVLTATAAKQEEQSGDSLATAEAKATQQSESVFATQTAQVAGRDESQLATATVAAPVLAELPFYGVDKENGHLGWLHDPLTLDISGYQQIAYGNDYMNVTAKDFILAADINWDTQYGGSGCGFMFRSDGDKNDPNQYMVIISRFANGRALFTALAEGELANLQDFYPKDQDKSFDWQNGTTNRLAVVTKGNLIEIYTNTVKIGEIDTTQPPRQPRTPPKPQKPLDQDDNDAVKRYQNQLKEYEDIIKENQSNYQMASQNFKLLPTEFGEGFLAMIALSQSGHTICRFENAWLWLIDQ
jgi:hypothetical protein